MAKKPEYTLALLSSFSRNGRGIGFLVNESDRHCDGAGVYKSLSGDEERALLTAFEGWLDHHDRLTNRFHGWPGHPKYDGCFTFKWRARNTGQRLYGFLHNVNEFQQGFRLCVLILHARKNERESDNAELNRVVDRRAMPEVIAALQKRIAQLRREGWPKKDDPLD